MNKKKMFVGILIAEMMISCMKGIAWYISQCVRKKFPMNFEFVMVGIVGPIGVNHSLRYLNLSLMHFINIKNGVFLNLAKPVASLRENLQQNTFKHQSFVGYYCIVDVVLGAW